MKRTLMPMGPQHPVLPEPLVLDLILEDERVVDAVPTIGYIHRGLEAMVERIEYTEMGFVVERICGICSFMHGMGYAVALEGIMGVEVPERARWLRLVWAEIARIQSHLLWLGLGADAFGFENLFMQCWRMREEVLDIFEQTTGGRIIHSVNRIGGVRRDISDAELRGIVSRLEGMGHDFKATAQVFRTDPSIRHRLGGVGVLPAADALHLGAVGPMARASGIALGHAPRSGEYLLRAARLRADHRDRRRLPRPRASSACARSSSRSGWSASWSSGCPRATDSRSTPRSGACPQGEAFVRLEQPRGEVVYYVRANGTKFLERFRARTPTFANIPSMIHLVRGCDLADVPNIILTIDPCISCTER